MKGALLTIAALLVLGTPASAQMGFSSGSGGWSGGGRYGGSDGFTGRPAPNQMGRHHRTGYGYGYYAYNDVGTNDAFDPDQYNDWWHDRPDRAYPRWVWHNQNCTPDRMWWSGAGWRCTP